MTEFARRVTRLFYCLPRKKITVVQQAFLRLGMPPDKRVAEGSGSARVHGQDAHVRATDLRKNKHSPYSLSLPRPALVAHALVALELMRSKTVAEVYSLLRPQRRTACGSFAALPPDSLIVMSAQSTHPTTPEMLPRRTFRQRTPSFAAAFSSGLLGKRTPPFCYPTLTLVSAARRKGLFTVGWAAPTFSSFPTAP